MGITLLAYMPCAEQNGKALNIALAEEPDNVNYPTLKVRGLPAPSSPLLRVKPCLGQQCLRRHKVVIRSGGNPMDQDDYTCRKEIYRNLRWKNNYQIYPKFFGFMPPNIWQRFIFLRACVPCTMTGGIMLHGI